MKKRIIFHRGFIIHNHEKERLVIVTPTQQKIWIKDAVSFDECKWWVDDKLAKIAIEKAFNRNQ